MMNLLRNRRMRLVGPCAIALALVGGFLLSNRKATGAASPTPLAAIESRRLTETEIRRIVTAGPMVLDKIFEDFGKSAFVQQTLKRIRPGFDLGRAVDQSSYASNVVRITEAFGAAGVGRLIKIFPETAVEQYKLNSKEVKELGTGIVKPLLLAQIFRNAQPSDRKRVQQYTMSYVEKRDTAEVDVANLSNGFWLSVLAGVVGNAVWQGLNYIADHLNELNGGDLDSLTSFQIRKEIAAAGKLRGYLSPAERRRIQLRHLDPARDPSRSVPR